MYRCITKITIGQQSSTDWPARNQVVQLDFCTSFESSDNWADLTNNGKLVFPKNLFYKDANGKSQSLAGPNVNVGGFNRAPLILRGDTVIIEAGYKYFNKADREIEETAIMFTGFVSKVNAKVPIELELEDNMWKLKQTPVTAHCFSKSDTLENMLAFLVKGTPYTYRALTDETTFGSFIIGTESVAQVLFRLQKLYGFHFYFRGNELRGGVKVYVDNETSRLNFRFQENIIADELVYKRKDDIILSAVAHNTITENDGFCKDGSVKTKKRRLQVLVTISQGKLMPYKEIKSGDIVPENNEGERHEFYIPGPATVNALGDAAYEKLKERYYTGLDGHFTTFGIPFVRQGDEVALKDPKLPERDGIYKVKGVNYTGGIAGLRQEIHLNYRIDLLNPNNV